MLAANDGASLPSDAARHGLNSLDNRYRFLLTVNLFDTDLTPSTDLAAIPAREICQLSGTVPVSVTTPKRTLM